MAVYLIGFAASLLLIAFAEKKENKLFLPLSVVALLIPCLIAGLRHENIGTDVLVYLKPMTESAINADSFREYFSSFWFSSWRNSFVVDYEYGFSLLVYFVAKLTSSLAAVQFAIQAFILVPVYIAIARNRKEMPVWIGMLVFYLFFFNTTLNMMRQWTAMGFLLLSFQMLREKKILGMTIFFLTSLLFHYSAIIAVPVYAVYVLLYVLRNTQITPKIKGRQFTISGPSIAIFCLIALALFALLNLNLILQLFSLIGFDRFSNYLEGDALRILPNQLILQLPLIVAFLFFWKQFKAHEPSAPFFLAMLLFDTIASQLISVDMYSFRIKMYFSMFSLLSIPSLCASPENKKQKWLTISAFSLYLLAYWVYNFVIQLRHDTIPYQFFFQ